MKKVLILVATLVLTTGCTDAYKMRWAKSEQFCSDNNTTAYQFNIVAQGIQVECKNGLMVEMSNDKFKQIVGPVVAKTLDDFWKSE